MRGLAMLILGALVSCTGGDDRPTDLLDSDPDRVTGDGWSQPTAAATWHWQLLGSVNTAYPVELYDIDLYDPPDSVFEKLRTNEKTIICYFSAGSHEDWRDDQGDFPEEVIGKRLDGWPGERWLDIRDARVLALLEKRLDTAVSRKCDLVEPDNVDGYQNNSGFDLTEQDQVLFLQHLSNAAHERGLGILLKNSADIVSTLEPWFDGAVVEQCAQYDECHVWDIVIAADKPVLQAEYSGRDTAAAGRDVATEVCPSAVAANRRALVLPLDLDDGFRIDCDTH